MKKFLLLILFLAAVLPLAARDQLWFIPGWLSSIDSYEPHKEQLALIYPDSDIKICYWKSTRLWHRAMNNAEAFAAELAQQIANSPHPEKIILIGHSLGGFIISHLAPQLKEQHIRVKAIVYLGAAIPFAHKGLDAAREVSIEPVINLFSYGDGILKYLYVNSERNLPLGLVGSAQKQKNLHQYHVDTGLSFNLSESYDELFNHLASKYLDALLVIKTHPSSSQFYADYRKLEKIAAHDSISIKNVSIPQVFKLPKVKEENHWMISYINVNMGFFSKKIWLLISPVGNHYMFYSYAAANRNFDHIQTQLKNSCH